MSRQIFLRYLLFYLSVSAILICGSSRRIPRGASCPSCSQDCPEALTVQTPWYPHRELNLQPTVLRDFSTDPFKNSVRSRLMQEWISQDITRDNNALSSQNSVPLANYESFSQQEPASGNSFVKKLFNKSPESFDRREIFSQDESANGYPPVHVVPSMQFFDKSENFFFRNPRNKYSESSSETLDQNYKNVEENPMSKVLVVYRADRDTQPLWEDSRDGSSSNIISPQRSFLKIENAFRGENNLDKERNTIKNLSNPSQQYDFAYPREKYNFAGFGLAEIKRPYVLPLKDLNMRKKNDEFFGNWNIARDSSQFSNLEQLKQAENKLLEVYPTKEQETITIENDNGLVDYDSYILSPDVNTWKLRKDRKSLDNRNFTAGESSQKSTEIEERRLQEAEDYWLRLYSLMGKHMGSFKNEEYEDKEYLADEEDMEYFDDETERDTIETVQDSYNPYILPQDMDIWRTKFQEDEELFDDWDFTRKNSQGLDKTEQLKIYSEGNNKYFQDEENKRRENVIFVDEARSNNDQVTRAPVINAYNAYILPRFLNILNDPVDSSEAQALLKAKNNILRANPIRTRDEMLFEDEAIIQDNAYIRDLILSKDLFDMEKYSNPAIKTQNIRDSNQNEALIEFDPDLLDDVENPPAESTESTPIESSVKFSTPQQQ